MAFVKTLTYCSSEKCKHYCNFVALTFWHRSFTFNSNKSPTWCNIFSVYYPDVRLQLNKFRAFSRPSSVAQWLQWQPLVLPSYRGDSRAVFVAGRPARPQTQHDCHKYVVVLFYFLFILWLLYKTTKDARYKCLINLSRNFICIAAFVLRTNSSHFPEH